MSEPLPAAARKRPWILLSLLAAMIAFRLWAMPHARFTGDESHQWSVARELAEGRHFPAYGLEVTGSVARLPGPACYVLIALPQLLGPSPLYGSTFVILLHALAAFLFATIASRARGPRAGLLGLALLVFAPWDVLYGDRIWGSSLAPVWAAVAIWAAVEAPYRRWAQGILLFFALTLPQLHLSAPIAWVSIAVLLWLQPVSRWSKRALGLGLLFAMLAYAPMLHAEVQSGFANTRAILGRGGGQETFGTLWQVPLRVLAYAIAYSTSEIGYHFARGYWGGGFDDLTYYGTLDGWRAWWRQHGAIAGGLGACSLALAFAAWGDEARRLFRERERRRTLDRALSWALLAGLTVGAALMMVARKKFFPHYANILMPLAVWPVVMSLNRWLDRGPRARAATLLALGGSAAGMALNTARYYLEVDGLNGLSATTQMVKLITDEPEPVRLEFTHFRNDYAFAQVARVLYGRELRTHPRAPVTWRVHNHERAHAPKGPEEQLIEGVRLERTPPEGGTLSKTAAQLRWREWRVQAIHPDGKRRDCVPTKYDCRYGEQPWQRFGPELMELDGQAQALLFLHPIEGAVVRAEFPLAQSDRRGVLRFGLSDGAVASSNASPVELRLLERGSTDDTERALSSAQTENRRGLSVLPFTRTTTGAGSLILELRCAHEGARIFGFDLELSAAP